MTTLATRGDVLLDELTSLFVHDRQMSSRHHKNKFSLSIVQHCLPSAFTRFFFDFFFTCMGQGVLDAFPVFSCECQQYQKDQIDECRRYRMIRVKRMERRFLESFKDESLRAQRKGAFVILVVAVVTAGVDPGLLDRQTEGERIVVVPFCVRKGMSRQRLNRCA